MGNTLREAGRIEQTYITVNITWGEDEDRVQEIVRQLIYPTSRSELFGVFGNRRTDLKNAIKALKQRKLKTKPKGDEQCAICLNQYYKNRIVMAMDCKHEFHKSCLEKWLRSEPRCPMCRQELSVNPKTQRNLFY